MANLAAAGRERAGNAKKDALRKPAAASAGETRGFASDGAHLLALEEVGQLDLVGGRALGELRSGKLVANLKQTQNVGSGTQLLVPRWTLL